MDNVAYTQSHTRTRTYSSKRIYKNISPTLRSLAVRNFLNGLFSVLFLLNLGKKKQFRPSRKRPLQISPVVSPVYK